MSLALCVRARDTVREKELIFIFPIGCIVVHRVIRLFFFPLSLSLPLPLSYYGRKFVNCLVHGRARSQFYRRRDRPLSGVAAACQRKNNAIFAGRLPTGGGTVGGKAARESTFHHVRAACHATKAKRNYGLMNAPRALPCHAALRSPRRSRRDIDIPGVPPFTKREQYRAQQKLHAHLGFA